jgi:hypothetical protein
MGVVHCVRLFESEPDRVGAFLRFLDAAENTAFEAQPPDESASENSDG